MENKKNKSFERISISTKCHVINIQDATNFDLGFPDLKVIPSWLIGNKKLITSNYSYIVRDRISLIENDPIEGIAFRVRLKGINEVSRSQGKRKLSIKSKNTKRNAKNELISINRDVGGIFYCNIYKADTFNRLLVELFHPVEGYSIVEMLLKEYPDIYCKFE